MLPWSLDKIAKYLRLRVHVYIWYVTNVSLWLLQNWYSGFLHVQVTEWVNNMRVVLANRIITVLVRLQRARISHLRAKCASNGTFFGEISTSICSPRCALTTVHQSFLCLWDSIRGPHEEFFEKKVFQFVSVCLQSLWVPALRESSCLSGIACSPVLLWHVSRNASCGPAVSHSGSV